MSRSRMTMRAAIERNTASGTDGWGGPVAPVFQSTGNPVPCFVWSTQRRDPAVEDGRKTVLVEDLRAMFPIGTDVRERDEIVTVTDRQGEVLIAGRLRVVGPPMRKHSHVETPLERLS